MKVLRISQCLILLVVLLAVGGLEIRQAHSQGDIPASPSDAQNVDYIGHLGGRVGAITVVGDYAYFNEGYKLAISPVEALSSVVGRTGFLPNTIQDITVAGDYAFLADGEGGLWVINISDPTNPYEVGFSDTPGYAYRLAVSGRYAYIADRESGMRVFDVSDPTIPEEVGFLDTSGDAVDVFVVGNYAYVADGDGGLQVIDVSDAANPVEVGFYNTPGFAGSVAVSGIYAYVADGWGSGLLVIDVSDPSDPAEISVYPYGGYTKDVVLAGDFAYLLKGTYDYFALEVVDISDPLNLRKVDSWGMYYVYFSNVAVAGDHAYVTGGDVTVIDVSDPENITDVGGYSPQIYIGLVEVVGEKAYLLVGEDIVKIGIVLHPGVCDVSDPANPGGVYSNAIEYDYNKGGVAVEGDYAYWVVGDLDIFDISGQLPINVGSYYTSGFAVDVAVAGSYAFLADWDGGLRIVDVSDPTNPSEVGHIDTPGAAMGVTVKGSYAYVADGGIGGLRVIDVSDPTNPHQTGFTNTPGAALDLVIAGDYVYVADGDSGLRVIDTSDHANPFEVGFYDTNGSAQQVVVVGDYAYVADGDDGLRVIDISDPTNPEEGGYFDTKGFATGVAVIGSYALVADSEGGLYVLNYTGIKDASLTPLLSDRPDPSLVGVPFMVRTEVGASFGIPSGMVTVSVDGEAAQCSARLNGGVGSCWLTIDPPGTYTLTASYSGDKYFLPSMTTRMHSVVPPILLYLPLMGG